MYVTEGTYLCGLIDDTIADGDAHEVDAHLVRGTDECGANKGRGEEGRGVSRVVKRHIMFSSYDWILVSQQTHSITAEHTTERNEKRIEQESSLCS